MRFSVTVVARLVVALAFAVAMSACPPGPPPVDVPECGVTNIVQAEALFVPPAAAIQLVLEGGDVCTPGAGDACVQSFDACDVDVGDVAVADVRRETLFVRAVNSPLTVFDARIEGDCPDVYVEGFFPGTFVSVGLDAPLTVVVNATSLGTCTAQLVLETDASNTDETDALTGNRVVRIDVLSNRVEGGVEGCTASVACCCDFALQRLPAQCEGERLTCLAQSTLLFTDQCDTACGAPLSTAWVTAEQDTLLFGPVRVDDQTGDVVVLHPAPCTVERRTRDGAPVWSRTVTALDACNDVAFAGVVLMITGDGDEVLVDASTGVEGATRGNEGFTVTAGTSDGVLTASRRDVDLVVRRTNSIGAVTSTFELSGVDASIAVQHVVAALDNGDVVVSFVREAGAPAVELPSVDGGVFVLGDADYTALLQLDGAGLVRRAFVMQSSVVANMDARGNAYVMCGGTQEAGALVELGALGEPANAIASFESARGFFVYVDDAGVVTFDEDGERNLTGVCGFDEVGDLFVLSTSNTALTLRSGFTISDVAQGRAVAMGAVLDDDEFIVVAVHGGVAGQEVLPLYPAGAVPLQSGSFVMRVPLVELGL